MSEGCYTFFGTVVDNNGLLTQTRSDITTATGRSNTLFAPALSTLVVHISGTASITLISNPVRDTAKDITISTISAAGRTTIASADYIALNVTAISGTVTAVLVPNED